MNDENPKNERQDPAKAKEVDTATQTKPQDTPTDAPKVSHVQTVAPAQPENDTTIEVTPAPEPGTVIGGREYDVDPKLGHRVREV